MFEDLFLVVYGLTVFMFLIGFTYLWLTGRWNKRIQTGAQRVVYKIEQQSGVRMNTSAMAVFIECVGVISFLLPLVNTVILINSIITTVRAKKAFEKGVKKVVDDHTKFLDD